MRILELQIKNFGKFKDKTIRFGEGVNIIYGQNEMGKSTIHAFIKGMFFGIEKQRGRAAKNDEYSLRQPWDNPGYFAGALRFESGGKVFRLERNFERREKSVYFLCETDGEELSVADGDLEVLLEGLNESSFQNTISIPQRSGETDGGLAVEVQRFMSNLESAGDSDIDVDAAIKRLTEQRKQLENNKKEKLAKTDTKLREVRIKYDYNEQEMQELKENSEETKRRRARTEEQKKNLQAECASFNSAKQDGDNRLWLVAIIGIVGAGIAIVAPIIWLKVAAVIAAAALAVFLLKGRMEPPREEQLLNAERLLRMNEQIIQLEAECQKQQWDIEHFQSEWKEKRTIRGNLQETMAEIQEEGKETRGIDREIEAIQLAQTCIKEVSEEFYKRTEKQLNQRVSDILCGITEGRYTNVFIDSDLQVRINTPEKMLTLQQVSRGTMEQIYFALRIAVGEMLCKKESMPVILDDAFVMYDDERLFQTLRWLYESERQVILFTCHKREQEMLERLKRA